MTIHIGTRNIQYYTCIVKYRFRINVKNLDIPKPKFTFAPGVFFEEAIENNEHNFNEIINNLRIPLLHIFDVNNSDWKYHMKM